MRNRRILENFIRKQLEYKIFANFAPFKNHISDTKYHVTTG